MAYVESFTFEERRDALSEIKSLASDDLENGNYPSLDSTSENTTTLSGTTANTSMSPSAFESLIPVNSWANNIASSGDLCINGEDYGNPSYDRICVRMWDPLVEDSQPSCGIDESTWPTLTKVGFSLAAFQLDNCSPYEPRFSLSAFIGIDPNTGCFYGGTSGLPGVATCVELGCSNDPLSFALPAGYSTLAWEMGKEAVYNSPDITDILDNDGLIMAVGVLIAFIILLAAASAGVIPAAIGAGAIGAGIGASVLTEGA